MIAIARTTLPIFLTCGETLVWQKNEEKKFSKNTRRPYNNKYLLKMGKKSSVN